MPYDGPVGTWSKVLVSTNADGILIKVSLPQQNIQPVQRRSLYIVIAQIGPNINN